MAIEPTEKPRFALFRRREKANIELSPLDAARASAIGLYTGQGPAAVVPMLSFMSAKNRGARTDRLANTVRNNPLLFGPAWKVSFRIGSLPIKVYHLHDDGTKHEFSQHPSYKLLRAPNEILTRNLLVSGTVFSLEQWGRAAWYKSRPRKGAKPEELWPIPGDVLYPVLSPTKLIDHFEIRLQGEKPVEIAKEDVIYFRLMVDPENWAEGMAPFMSLGDVAEYGYQAIDAATDFFEHALLGRMWVDMGMKELTPQARARLSQQMEVARRDRYAVPVLEDGAQLKNMGKEPTGEVLAGAISSSEQLIHDTMGMPSNATTARWTPAEEQKLFFGEVVQPIADALEQELERSYFSEWGTVTDKGESGPVFGEFQFREILAGDPHERALLWQTKILSGQATPNEARRAENEPPLPGGDDLMGPLNLARLRDNVAEKKVEAASNAPAPPGIAQGVPPAKDSKGGMGGQEGKNTVPDAQLNNPNGPTKPKPQPQLAKAAAGEEEARFRSSVALRNNWRTLRTRLLSSQGEAARRRLRGLLREELKSLRSHLEAVPPVTEPPFPQVGELAAEIHGNNEAYRNLLAGFMEQTGRSAHQHAAELIGQQSAELPALISEAVMVRATEVSDRFTERRVRTLEAILAKSFDSNVILEQVTDDWENMALSFASGMATTETSWSHEQAAIDAWARGGVEQFELIPDPGPCETGVCTRAAEHGLYRLREPLENVGYTFTDADAPPLHPYCGCLIIPVFE